MSLKNAAARDISPGVQDLEPQLEAGNIVQPFFHTEVYVKRGKRGYQMGYAGPRKELEECNKYVLERDLNYILGVNNLRKGLSVTVST